MRIEIKSFPALTTSELYAILRLRQEVFIVEQQCFYLDADGKDQESVHLLAWEDEEGELKKWGSEEAQKDAFANSSPPQFFNSSFDSTDPPQAIEPRRLLACLRILPPGLSYETAGIGRMAVAKEARGKGLGAMLMRKALEIVRQNYGSGQHAGTDVDFGTDGDRTQDTLVTITAQLQAEAFYRKLGFKTVGEPFDEAGLPHVKMVAA